MHLGQNTVGEEVYITVGRRVNSWTCWFDHRVVTWWKTAEGVSRGKLEEDLGGNFRVERQLLRRVIDTVDAVDASFAIDELLARFLSKLRFKFVPTLTALDRLEN